MWFWTARGSFGIQSCNGFSDPNLPEFHHEVLPGCDSVSELAAGYLGFDVHLCYQLYCCGSVVLNVAIIISFTLMLN